MYNNYLYLIRTVIELNQRIKNLIVSEIFTQERDKLFLNLHSKKSPNEHLIISTSPNKSYLTIKEEFYKAKKNYRNFFQEVLPDKINDVSIALNERIIKLSMEKSLLYFMIRGTQSNVILVHNSSFSSFKKMNESEIESLAYELKTLNFFNNQKILLNSLQNMEFSQLLTHFKFVNKIIQEELTNRTGDFSKSFQEIINDIMNGSIVVGKDIHSNKFLFIPSSFRLVKNLDHAQKFENYFDAVNYLIAHEPTIQREQQLKNSIDKFIQKEMERVTNKLNNIKSIIEPGSKEIDYSRNAELLLANINKIKKGMKSINLVDPIMNKELEISLDEKLSPNKNVDRLFEKARAAKINYKKSLELYSQLKKEHIRLQEILNKLGYSKSFKDLLSIKKELHMKEPDKGGIKGEQIRFRHYIIDGKYNLYVGKDSKNNDLLTTRFAKQNDFWFHARSVSGSHVVLRVENIKEVIPKNILKKAASIAAFYSKAKTSKLVPVSYTHKKYVTKRKDLEPGQVILIRENVLLVSPEIPSGCEIQSSE